MIGQIRLLVVCRKLVSMCLRIFASFVFFFSDDFLSVVLLWFSVQVIDWNPK